MKARPTCAACILLRRALEVEHFKSRSIAAAISRFRSILEAATLYLGPDIEAALLATITFRRLKSLLGDKDPYAEIKDKLLLFAMDVAEKLREILSREGEASVKLELALKAAAYVASVERGLGSFYIGAAEALKIIGGVDTLLSVVGARIGVNHSRRLVEVLSSLQNPTIYYLTGTVAELPFDIIVMDILREEFNAYVAAVVRSEAYEDYVTVVEAEKAKLHDHVDEVVETGSDSVTVTLEDSREAYSLVSRGDIVVVKGVLQSLYMINNPPGPHLLLLFTTNCPIAASRLNVKTGTINIVFVEGRRSQPG